MIVFRKITFDLFRLLNASSYRSQTSDDDDNSSIANNNNDLHSIRSWSRIIDVIFCFFIIEYFLPFVFLCFVYQCTTQNDLVISLLSALFHNRNLERRTKNLCMHCCFWWILFCWIFFIARLNILNSEFNSIKYDFERIISRRWTLIFIDCWISINRLMDYISHC